MWSVSNTFWDSIGCLVGYLLNVQIYNISGFAYMSVCKARLIFTVRLILIDSPAAKLVLLNVSSFYL